MGGRKLDDITRFWSYVKTGEWDECWPWQGYTRGNTKYGGCLFQGRQQSAHRVSYQINIGPIPEGLHVCHRCDNPICVNPAHLWLGTPADNMHDMARKGRWDGPVGIETPGSKLTEAQVTEIRELLKVGVSQRKIAKQYGVSSPAICHINTGIAWKHLK